jgi:hypothetical protein
VDGSGLRNYWVSVDLDLKPGDTVKVNGEQFEVDQISSVIGLKSEVMEFQEASGV